MAARFESKVAVVTGGASGIGAAIARRLVAEGGTVVVGDINQQGLDAVASELGVRCLGVWADVTDESQIEALVGAAVGHFGALHLGFNVAGAARAAPIIELSEAEWDFTVDLCAKGVVFALKHQARQMVAQGGGGAIVNVSSLNSQVPMFGGVAYCAAKAAAAMVSQVGSLELAEHGIRVNTVSPGLVFTPLTEAIQQTPAVVGAFLDRIPMQRAGTPDDIAAAALYLASDDASYVSGVNLFVDGAWAQSGYPDLRRLFAGDGPQA